MIDRLRRKQLFVRFTLTALTLLGTPVFLTAAPPAGYYDSAAGLSGNNLRNALHDIIDDHTRYRYTSSLTDTWDILSDADEDPGNSSNVLTIYKNTSVAKTNTATDWNREHTWPKSYGFPNDNTCNYAYTDCHHLMAANPGYNSSRGNRHYDVCASCTEYTVTGSTSSNWGGGGAWEVWDDRKGDIARAMFYMDVRYEGGTHGVTACSEPDLILTDNTSLITTTGSNASTAYMGVLSTLLAWHLADPVDTEESLRNDIVYSYQGNRNPFVDHPEWVCSVYGITGCSGTVSANVWINEVHYDNSGSDTGEGVEIAGPAGTSLSGWSIYAYNGNSGTSYNNISLSGTLPNTQNSYGVAWFSFSGLQNGAPDGIALVDDSSNVVQFLSYEGSFLASGGPADGMTSTDIGVSESGSNPVGDTLQLSGTGTEYADFTWQTPDTGTTAGINNSQSFGAAPPPADPWINEIHYDNVSGDTGEGIEIAGTAGLDLTGWSIYAYNGSNSSTYNNISLSGTLPNTQNGYGVAWFAFSGLQNGAPDAIALVDDSSNVIQFLSYEGSFTASGGPADGLTSTDIGVSESGSTAVGDSLQLSGTGTEYTDFTWQSPNTATTGSANNSQTLGP